MKNRKVIITKVELNTNQIIVIDSTLAVSGNYDISNQIEAKILHPNYVYLDNNSGTDLLWNVISNQREFEDYQNFPNQYELIPLKSSKLLQSVDRTPRCYKFLIQKNPLSPDAKNDIEVYFVNYN